MTSNLGEITRMGDESDGMRHRASWLAARPWGWALGSVCLWAAPRLSLACAVCGFGREENRMAFLLTTVVLSVLPLMSIGGVVFWIWRQARLQAQEIRSPERTDRGFEPTLAPEGIRGSAL